MSGWGKCEGCGSKWERLHSGCWLCTKCCKCYPPQGEMKRYDPYTDPDGGFASMSERETGSFVRHSDHEAEVAAEKATRVKYQSIVYDACRVVDAAFGNNITKGEGVTVDVLVQNIEAMRVALLASLEPNVDAVKRLIEVQGQYAELVKAARALLEHVDEGGMCNGQCDEANALRAALAAPAAGREDDRNPEFIIGETVEYQPSWGVNRWYRGKVGSEPRSLGDTIVVQLYDMEPDYARHIHPGTERTTIAAAAVSHIRKRRRAHQPAAQELPSVSSAAVDIRDAVIAWLNRNLDNINYDLPVAGETLLTIIAAKLRDLGVGR